MVLPQKTMGSTELYFAGTAEKNGELLANGGRIFLVAAQAANLEKARNEVYDALKQMSLPEMFYRHDIGAKALK